MNSSASANESPRTPAKRGPNSLSAAFPKAGSTTNTASADHATPATASPAPSRRRPVQASTSPSAAYVSATSSFIANATAAVTRNQTTRSRASRTHPPTSSTGTSVSGWKSCSAGRSTTGDAHQRSAGTAATHPRAPCARARRKRSGAVAASARVCTTRRPGAPTPSVPSGARRAIPGSTWSPRSVRRLIVLNGSFRWPSSQTYCEKIPWSKSEANDS